MNQGNSTLSKSTSGHETNLAGMVARKSYNEEYYQHTQGSGIKTVNVAADGKHAEILWVDDKTSRYHSLWLRATCYCATCRTGTQSTIDYENVPEDLLLLSAEDDGEGCLVIRWQQDPGHTGLVPLNLLKANCYSKESLKQKRESRNMTFPTKTDAIPKFTYDDVMGSRNGMFRWMKALNEPGLALVTGVPSEEYVVEKMAEHFGGLIQHTVFGKSFIVKSMTDAENPAWTSGDLKLHMDQPVYENLPGIQFLHCLQFDDSVKGGESVLVDMFHVAETFRQEHPKEFKVLCEVPITFEEINYGGFVAGKYWPVQMRMKIPMFTLNGYGDLIGVRWRPNLLGPLQIEEEFIEPFFRAYKKFYSLTINFPYKYKHRLRAGEVITMNNRRVAHGRTAYSGTGSRYLRGCYVEISEFKSRLEVLSNLEGGGCPVKRVGDIDWQ